MRRTAQHKALTEKRIELRLWKQWRRERLEALLAGPYAEPAQALLAFFKTMTGAGALVEFVMSGPWADADEDVRYEILSLVKRRERMGLAPIDDSLPGQPENAFLILRARLGREFPV